MLIKFGIKINIQDYEYQFTALHYSVNLNNIKLTSLLLNANADPNIQDVLGNTPLHYAIIETNYNILDYHVEALFMLEGFAVIPTLDRVDMRHIFDHNDK